MIRSTDVIQEGTIQASRQSTRVLAFTMVLVLAAFATQIAQGQTYKVIYTFTAFDGTSGGSYLVRDAAGNFVA
jgi:hypothetical protein